MRLIRSTDLSDQRLEQIPFQIPLLLDPSFNTFFIALIWFRILRLDLNTCRCSATIRFTLTVPDHLTPRY